LEEVEEGAGVEDAVAVVSEELRVPGGKTVGGGEEGRALGRLAELGGEVDAIWWGFLNQGGLDAEADAGFFDDVVVDALQSDVFIALRGGLHALGAGGSRLGSRGGRRSLGRQHGGQAESDYEEGGTRQITILCPRRWGTWRGGVELAAR